MTARNSKGVTICVTKGSAVAASLVPTAIAKEAAGPRAEVTVASTATIKAGDLIKVPTGGTGFKELDGKTFTVASVTTGKFVLNGSDLTSTVGVLAASPTLQHYPDSAMTCLCLNDIKFNAEKGTTISVATYCDTSASIPSASTKAGTVTFGGYVDVTTDDYKELLAAEADGVERIFRIKLPSNGEIVFPGIISTFGWQIPLDGAVAYEGEIALGSRPRHLF